MTDTTEMETTATTEQHDHNNESMDEDECTSIYDYHSDHLEYLEDKYATSNNGYVGNNIGNHRFLHEPNNSNINNNINNGHVGRSSSIVPDVQPYCFEHVYQCYPVSYTGMTHLEQGNKILMPPSALECLMFRQQQVTFPMLFEIENQLCGLKSHCGVGEFTAEEGTVFLPNWLMEFLQLQAGDYMKIKRVNLETGTYMKLQPHSMDFISLANPKAVLEKVLTNHYFCLSTGDTILIHYNNKDFYINVVETRPASAISIVNIDCELEFAPPLDYKEPERPAPPVKTVVATAKPAIPEKEKAADNKEKPKFEPFRGQARRLDGKSTETDLSSQKEEHATTAKFPVENTIQRKPRDGVGAENSKNKQFKAFTGKSYSLMG